MWTFGNIAALPLASGGTETVYMVTHIEDPLGNFIDIDYDSLDSLRSIQKITDSMDREVRFIKSYQGSDPAKLAEIRIKNHDETHDVILSYSVGSFSNGFYKLSSFTPPGLSAATFGYNDGLSYNYELTSVTSSYGGVLEYTYQNHNFYFSTTQLDSKVVSQKQITFNPGEQATWNYTYPTYQGASSGTATVDGPEFDTTSTHYTYQSAQADRWRIGLETSAALGDGSFSATRTWTYHEISTTSWMVLGFNMGTARGPLPLSVTESPTGDSTLKRDYYYLRNGGTSVMRYGLPTKISYFINGSATAKSYTELGYYFETHTSFKDKYMLALPENSRDKSVAGVIQRETISSYFDETGTWGALKQMKRLKTGQTYYTWDFTYVRDAENVTISIDGPGDGGISQVLYRYGVEQEASAPGFLKYTRSISKYGYIEAEWNQYRGTKSYDYDDLGRTISVKLWHGWEQGQPPPLEYFLMVSYNWRPNGENRVEITHGDNTTIQYWDGMGRGTGYTEAGDATTLYYRKTLDAEGRVKFADGGHTTSTPEYAYLYDAAGRVTRITDPLSHFTTIVYSGHTRTVTDPENHATIYSYADLPGLPTALTDAQSHAASYTYDPAGRLTTVSYLGRTQSYSYDGLDHVLSEEHPETGLIQYTYDTANRLSLKSWGGSTESYVYNSSGQLVSTQGAETVTYAYDDKGAAAARRAARPDGKGDKMMTGAPATGTFYIYAFDGRLLAEYDVSGQLVREYIYFSGMLVAEYRNQESRLLYYASDQINSTRIVTDNLGNVVYAAAHEPYGGIQKTWPSTYEPSLKFSGKERDAESELDYFGARYYDRSQFRLLSPNPVSAGSGFAPNSQAWNAYSYPGNQPWAEEYVSAGWMASATSAEAVIRPKPPMPPKPPKPEPEKIKSSEEKRPAEEHNWRSFRENWEKAENAARLWMRTSDPAFFVQLVTISKGLEKEMWGYIAKYEYGSDPVMDAYLADYGMSTDPDNPLSFWNPCYVMYHLYYNI